MGHSHYWQYHTKMVGFASRYKVMKTEMKSFVKFAMEQGYVLANGLAEPDTSPVFLQSSIFFNGAGEDGHETMFFEGKARPSNFCKTNYKPYDAVVIASLLVAKQYMGPLMSISSDGVGKYWNAETYYFEIAEGVNLCLEYLIKNGIVEDNTLSKRAFISNVIEWCMARLDDVTTQDLATMKKIVHSEHFTIKLSPRRSIVKMKMKAARRRRQARNKR